MGQVTGISWCDHTFNAWWGCEKVSPACDNCYAESTSNRYGFKIWGQDSARRLFTEKHWREPLKWNALAAADKTQRRAFSSSMADVLEDRRDLDPERLKLAGLIADTQWIDWLLLSKRPQNFHRLLFSPGKWFPSAPKNVWGMTTVESNEYLWRVDELLSLPFSVIGLSVEPMLAPVKLDYLRTRKGLVNWVIVGAESGSGARTTELKWVRDLRDECKEAGINFFVKQLVLNGKLTKNIAHFPEDLQIQQFPKSAVVHGE